MDQPTLIDKLERTRIRHSHRHPPVTNVNQAHAEALTPGQRIADSFAVVMGSWTFIIVQSVLLGALDHREPDRLDKSLGSPYPFILLNLVLSFQAAYAAPIIMMSQNRQSAKDRLMAEQDYQVNTKAEEEVKAIMHHLEQQDEVMIDILRRIEDQHRTIMGALAIRQDGGANSAPA